jgi:S-(hydroxymethyl)mycothiol dehydrogenase
MPSQVRAVIAPAKDEPVRVETITVPDPGPGEALVRVQACGVCHTDLHYRRAASATASPTCWGTRRPGSWSRSATA